MFEHMKYGLIVFSIVTLISLISQCSDGEEIIPATGCSPQACEFNIADIN